MTLGQMNKAASLMAITSVVDAEGFKTQTLNTVASFRCYREGRHGSKRWSDLAAFGDVTNLFRFRVIPGVTVTTDHRLICEGETFEIVSVENIRGANMYIEILAREVVPTNG